MDDPNSAAELVSVGSQQLPLPSQVLSPRPAPLLALVAALAPHQGAQLPHVKLRT